MLQRCNSQKAWVLNNHLMILNHIEEGNNQFFIIHCDNAIQVLLDIWENLIARAFNRCTICDSIDRWNRCHFAILKGCFHTSCTGWLNTDDFDIVLQHLGQCGYACCQTTAANWNKNIIYQWQILNHFHSDCSLSCCYAQIIKWMNKCITMLCCQFISFLTCLIINITVKNHFCTISLCTLYLDQRCGRRHDDNSLYTITLRRIGNPLCMIAGRCRNQTSLSLFLCKRTDCVISASQLVGTCQLHILWFKIYLIACVITEIFAVNQTCFLCHFLHCLTSCLKSR